MEQLRLEKNYAIVKKKSFFHGEKKEFSKYKFTESLCKLIFAKNWSISDIKTHLRKTHRKRMESTTRCMNITYWKSRDGAILKKLNRTLILISAHLFDWFSGILPWDYLKFAFKFVGKHLLCFKHSLALELYRWW